MPNVQGRLFAYPFLIYTLAITHTFMNFTKGKGEITDVLSYFSKMRKNISKNKISLNFL